MYVTPLKETRPFLTSHEDIPLSFHGVPRGGDRRIASGSPLFHVAARRDVNCPVIRGEFHRGTSTANETGGGRGGGRGPGKAETERENGARRRMMNGGVMVVSRAKPKYKWNGQRKSTRGRQRRLEQGGRLGVACDS